MHTWLPSEQGWGSKLKYPGISSTRISNQASSCWHPQYMGQVRWTSAITPSEKELWTGPLEFTGNFEEVRVQGTIAQIETDRDYQDCQFCSCQKSSQVWFLDESHQDWPFLQSCLKFIIKSQKKRQHFSLTSSRSPPSCTAVLLHILSSFIVWPTCFLKCFSWMAVGKRLYQFRNHSD